jgi:hypothetical protein
MMRRTFLVVLRVVIGLALVVGAAKVLAQEAAPGKQLLQVEDLYQFDVPIDVPTSVMLSPDGKRAAFIRQWLDPYRKEEQHSLWLTSGNLHHGMSMDDWGHTFVCADSEPIHFVMYEGSSRHICKNGT